MLRILVCVKQVPDVDQLRMDPETGSLIRDGVPSILNPQDANALSAALSVKESFGGEVTAITMGPPMAESALRECLAAGADRAVLVTDPDFERNARYGREIEDSLYTVAYDAYRQGYDARVIELADSTAKRFPTGLNRPKFLFLYFFLY